jgi:hypothetical protein
MGVLPIAVLKEESNVEIVVPCIWFLLLVTYLKEFLVSRINNK